MTLQSTNTAVRLGKIMSAWALTGIAFYLLLESLFFCCISYLFPYAARVSFGFGIYPLLQTSKAGTIPNNYIAIFGDSFGFGTGDQFHNTQHESNPAFNVTHRLHDKMGRDFVSFAIPHSSNLCGWTEDPIASMNYINATWFHHIEPPAEILLYFYEGNDIADTHIDLQDRYLANGYTKEKLQEASYFSEFIKKEMLEKNHINRKAATLGFSDNFMLASYIKNVAEERKNREIVMNYIRAIQPSQPGKINRVILEGKETALPDKMPSPPMNISATHIDETLDFISAIAGYVRKQYPAAAISIVYIPSTITSYRITSETVSIYNPDAETIFTSKAVTEQSNDLCQAMYQIANKHSLGFLDTRATLLDHSNNHLLHGPLDWGHLNKAGYDALADAILQYLQAQDSGTAFRTISPCTTL